jgi:hypothetical protein
MRKPVFTICWWVFWISHHCHWWKTVCFDVKILLMDVEVGRMNGSIPSNRQFPPIAMVRYPTTRKIGARIVISVAMRSHQRSFPSQNSLIRTHEGNGSSGEATCKQKILRVIFPCGMMWSECNTLRLLSVAHEMCCNL